LNYYPPRAVFKIYLQTRSPRENFDYKVILGEMFSQLTPKDILVPDGFAITPGAYRLFLKENKLK